MPVLNLRGMVQTCPQCTIQTQSWVDFCPECGARISHPGRIRALGWVLMVIGALLSAGMAYLLVLIDGIIRNSDDPDATTRFTGTAADAAFAYGVMGLVLVFGLVAVTAGAWQVRNGTRNPRLVKVVLALAALFVAAGSVVRYLN